MVNLLRMKETSQRRNTAILCQGLMYTFQPIKNSTGRDGGFTCWPPLRLDLLNGHQWVLLLQRRQNYIPFLQRQVSLPPCFSPGMLILPMDRRGFHG